MSVFRKRETCVPKYRMLRKFVQSRVENPRSGISPRGDALCSAKGARTSLAPGPTLLVTEGFKAGLWTPTDIGLSPRPAGNSRFVLSLPVRGGAGLGTPHFPSARPRSAPARAGPIKALPWLHSPAPATWVPLPDLSRPSLPTCPPTGPAFQCPQPPSEAEGPRAATWSGVGGQAGAWARAAGPPGAGEGGRPLSSRERVNALHLGPACS
jgi:hypothetical protein